MSFQILNKDNEAIAINELDQEACDLWGKTIDKKQYAYPEIKPDKFENFKEEWKFVSSVTNWFDKIGYRIHSGIEDWDQLKAEILAPFEKFPIEEIMQYTPIAGYINLIDHWKSKGYQPKCTKE